MDALAWFPLLRFDVDEPVVVFPSLPYEFPPPPPPPPPQLDNIMNGRKLYVSSFDLFLVDLRSVTL